MIRLSPKLFVLRVGQLVHEIGGCDTALCVYVEFDLQQIFLKCSHQIENQFNYEGAIVLL